MLIDKFCRTEKTASSPPTFETGSHLHLLPPFASSRIGTRSGDVRYDEFFGCSSTILPVLIRKAEEWAVYLIDERLEGWPDMSQDYPPPFPSKDGDHVAPVLQTMNESLTSPAGNSTTTSVREAGTCKDVIQEYYSCSRKNPRMETATIGESFAPKRRRTTLMPQVETGAGDQLAA